LFLLLLVLINVKYSDATVDLGTRCTLEEYVVAGGLTWNDFVDRMAKPETWGDVLCLFAVPQVFNCSVVVCSKTFPFADFCCRFGDDGPELILAHWKEVQFRSVLQRDEWDVLYQQKKREKGLAGLDHRLYSGLLRYQDRTEEAILHCQLEVQRDAKSLVGHHTWAIVLSDKFRADEVFSANLRFTFYICFAFGNSIVFASSLHILHLFRAFENSIVFASLHICVFTKLTCFLCDLFRRYSIIWRNWRLLPIIRIRITASEQHCTI
jgi:hypothetical protein